MLHDGRVDDPRYAAAVPAPSPPLPPHVHVAIAGSGFGGLGAGIRLKEMGEHDFVVLERAASLGGVWRDNTYPGAACDVRSHLYSYSFARNPGWTHAYSPQAEIRAYLEACADRFDVRPHVRFDHEILEASWDEASCRWRLETTRGALTADVFVSAVGALSEPRWPSIPGLGGFSGKAFHSARWDHAFDLSGKRVAVIGTGASAIQFVPAIQPVVKELTVFQRTPPWVLPRFDRPFGPLERRLLEASPALQRLSRGALYAFHEVGALAFFYPEVARLVQRRALAHLAESVADAELRNKLTPSYTWGCKRILLSDFYYPAITKPNVDVVTDAITRITPTGVATADGRERAVDAIICGTGFQVQEYPFGSRVRGEGGRSLAQTWERTMTAHLGTTVAGFPNLFLIQGPNSVLGHSSVVTMIEAQIEHMTAAVRHMRRTGVRAVAPRPEAQAAFVAKVDRDMRGTVWTAGGCASWYLDRDGRNSALWPGFATTFVRRVAHFDPEEYRMTPDDKSTTKPKSQSARPLERVAFLAARAMTRLPERLQRRLAGGKTVRSGPYTLDAAMQLVLASDPRLKMEPQDPLRLRREKDRAAIAVRGAPPPVGAVRDLVVDGADGPLRARLYSTEATATEGAALPLLVYFHGGGFVFGDLETHDVGCRLLCRHGGLHVLAVEYRLVPEHRFPAAIEDGRAAFAWAVRHAKELGADPLRIGVGGDSAGANIAAIVSLLARKQKPAPACQLLIYPPTDRTKAHPSMNELAEGFMLTRASVEWFHAQYAASVGADSADPRISPLLATEKDGLAPALVVTAGFDPLRDEGEAYAEALRAAGTPTVLRRFDTLIHGFFNMTGFHEPSRDAVVAIAGATRVMFDMPRPRDTQNGVGVPKPISVAAGLQ
jgi:cation diffusion facilitator CzcD-associated flavoprotein CzcO/acetyl esterase/lipase